MDKLTAMDYLNKPVRELVVHPDFSQYALEVVTAFMSLHSDQLELIDLSHIPVTPKETNTDAQR